MHTRIHACMTLMYTSSPHPDLQKNSTYTWNELTVKTTEDYKNAAQGQLFQEFSLIKTALNSDKLAQDALRIHLGGLDEHRYTLKRLPHSTV